MAKDVKFNIRFTIDGKEQVVTATQCIRNMKNSVSGVSCAKEYAIGI